MTRESVMFDHLAKLQPSVRKGKRCDYLIPVICNGFCEVENETQGRKYVQDIKVLSIKHVNGLLLRCAKVQQIQDFSQTRVLVMRCDPVRVEQNAREIRIVRCCKANLETHF